MSIEIESADVIRLIQQYLKESNLTRTLQTLQEETGISLNTVDSVDALCADVHAGQWGAALGALRALALPERAAALLYEQLALELCELREAAAARALLRQAPALRALQRLAPERHLALEAAAARGYFDPREAYGAGGRERRRAAVAAALAAELSVVPPSRLLALLGQALKWQQHQGLLPPGTAIDLFRGKACARQEEDDAAVATLTKSIKFGAKSHVEVARFSPDGQYLVTGSVDGLLEVWNFATGKLRRDLRYQAGDDFMSMPAAVLSLCVAPDSDTLAAGDAAGGLAVWRLSTGAVQRRWERAHARGVTCLSFSRDGSQLLSGSYDATLKLHGLKSGKLIRSWAAHADGVSDCVLLGDGRAASGGRGAAAAGAGAAGAGAAAGAALWGRGGLERALADGAVRALLPLPAREQLLAVRAHDVLLLTLQGQLVRALTTGAEAALLAAALSPRARFLYCAAEDRRLYVFDLSAGKLDRTLNVSEAALVGVAHHPQQNLLATYAEDGLLKLWRP